MLHVHPDRQGHEDTLSITWIITLITNICRHRRCLILVVIMMALDWCPSSATIGTAGVVLVVVVIMTVEVIGDLPGQGAWHDLQYKVYGSETARRVPRVRQKVRIQEGDYDFIIVVSLVTNVEWGGL
jgi:hypothetical protein